jgi:hypothetical protein
VLCGTLNNCAADCSRCCDPHQSVIAFNNLCNLKCWHVSASRGTPELGCECATNNYWRFSGANIVDWQIASANGEKQRIDYITIWDHNLCLHGGAAVMALADGQVIQPENYTSTEVPILPKRRRGGDKYCAPIVICVAGIELSSLRLRFMLPNIEQEYCVGNIAAMCAEQLPKGLAPGFANPFTAGTRDLKSKNNKCGGRIGTTNDRVPIDLEFTAQAVTDCWLRDVWIDEILPYAEEKHEVHFGWSKNRYPEELFRGWIVGRSQPATSRRSQKSDLTIAMKGWRDQLKL